MMCQACSEADATFRDYLLRRPDERGKLSVAQADYYGFRRDPATGQWIDAWVDQIRADFRTDAVESAKQ